MVKIKQKEQKRINEALRLLDNAYNVKINTVKINVGNTLEHELAKCKVAYELIKEGKQVVTEAIFKGGGRADVFCLNDFRVIEILHSEQENEALAKITKYPKQLDLIFFRSKEVLNGK